MTEKWDFPTQTIDDIVDGADHTISLLSEVVRVSPSSRLHEYRKVLAEYAAEGGPSDAKRNQIVCRALVELSSLSVISRGLSRDNSSKEFCELLSQIVGGQVLPDEEKNSIARNTQLHLYIAAVLKASGTNVEFEEPDLLAHIDGRVFGVAAKRITSLKQFEKRISEGKDQLSRAKKRGIVWIDITDAMLKYSGLFVFDDAQALFQHQADMEAHASRTVDEIKLKLSKSTHLVDVILSWIIPRTISDSGSFETAEFLQFFDLYEPETIEGKVANAFRTQIESGLDELGQLH